MTATLTATQTLNTLKQQELALNANKVQIYWQQQSENLSNQFFAQQRQFMAERVKLENVALEAIAESLRTFEPALSAGCANLEQEIDTLANAIAFLNALSDVTSVVAKIVSFVA